VLLAALIYFIGNRIAANWVEVSHYQWHVDYLLLTLSLLTMLVALMVMSSSLARVFGAFGKSVSYARAFRIAYLSQLGRYVPGKVWQVPAMVYLAGKEGVGKAEAVTSFALAQLFTTPPAILATAPLFILGGFQATSEFDLNAIGYILLAVVAGSVVLLLRPDWLSGILNKILSRLGKEHVQFSLEKKSGGLILLMYFVGWNMYGLAFYLFLLSVSEFSPCHFLQAIGVFCASYLIGYWSVFAPGGIGVREAVLVLLLTPYLGVGVSAAVAAGARLWSIIGELIASAIAWRIK
jgi:hypothetical protein